MAGNCWYTDMVSRAPPLDAEISLTKATVPTQASSMVSLTRAQKQPQRTHMSGSPDGPSSPAGSCARSPARRGAGATGRCALLGLVGLAACDPTDKTDASSDTACPTPTLATPASGSVVGEGPVSFSWSPTIDGTISIAGVKTPVSGDQATLELSAGDVTWWVEGCTPSDTASLRITEWTPLDALSVSDRTIQEELPDVGRVVAHLMTWFGEDTHIDVGYDSTDPAVAAAQVAAARSRGLSGFVVDWYAGVSPHIDTGFEVMLDAADNDFSVGLVYDYGALRWGVDDPEDGEAVTLQMKTDLEEAHARYMTHPSYLTVEGQPVVFLWVYDDITPDLASVREALEKLDPPPMLFDLHPDEGSAPSVDGFFAWADLEGEFGEDYLSWFYDTQDALYPEHQAIGAAWPGFDDSLASWGQGRYQDPRCGATLYDTLELAADHMDATGASPELFQLVTWNDYEEGTAIEPGVDACLDTTLTLTTGPSGDELTWTVTDPSGLLAEVVLLRLDPDDTTRGVMVGRSTESTMTVTRPDPTQAATYQAIAVGRALLTTAQSGAATAE